MTSSITYDISHLSCTWLASCLSARSQPPRRAISSRASGRLVLPVISCKRALVYWPRRLQRMHSSFRIGRMPPYENSKCGCRFNSLSRFTRTISAKERRGFLCFDIHTAAFRFCPGIHGVRPVSQADSLDGVAPMPSAIWINKRSWSMRQRRMRSPPQCGLFHQAVVPNL